MASIPSAPPIRSGRLWPVRLMLLGIVLTLLVPGLVFCWVLLEQVAHGERTRSVEATRAAASRAADSLDRELGNLDAALLALSTSTLLEAGQLARFSDQAATVARALGQEVVLAGRSGQVLLAVGPEGPQAGPDAPARIDASFLGQVLSTGRPAVSSLLQDRSGGGRVVYAGRPVQAGNERAVLLFRIEPALFSRLLQQQSPPEGWLLAAADAHHRVLARSTAADRYLGHVVTQDVQAHADVPEATWTGVSLDGTPVLVSLLHLRRADWTVVAGASLAVIEAPLWRIIRLLAIGGSVALVLACLCTWLLGRSLSRPLRQLAGAGPAIAAGLPAAGVVTRIAEVNAVSRALVSATRDLRERADRIAAERTAALEAANQRLRDEAAAREQAEAQLRQVQKMEAVGQLTGGIAHDFNNLLTIVIGSLDLLRRRGGDERGRRLIDNALEGAQRAATLTQRLLAFSRRQPLMPTPIDVNRLVAGMSDLLRRTLGEKVQVETVLAGGLWQTYADANQLENALLNLAVNGRDAIAAAGRAQGRLVIRTSNAVLDAAALASESDVEPGEYVQIAVSDNGPGMPPEVVARVFEPFFTTKPQGQGTGLGLSQVHGFVKQSGGHVAIDTRPGEGTTVSIYMPRHRAAAVPSAAAEEAACDSGTAGVVVLAVEDDAEVRRTSVAALRELGHVVLEAETPGAALRLLEAHPEVGLLFTDVRLPEMDGGALAAAARARHPGLPVLFVSGFIGSDEPSLAPLLLKPFTLQALATRLREVLGPPPDSGGGLRPAGFEPATKPL